MNKQADRENIAKRINTICAKASCFVCAEADKYEDYKQCPYLALKQIARDRKITAEDISEDLI